MMLPIPTRECTPALWWSQRGAGPEQHILGLNRWVYKQFLSSRDSASLDTDSLAVINSKTLLKLFLSHRISVKKMPPKAAKSKEAPAERPILGRFSSHLKIGIVSSYMYSIRLDLFWLMRKCWISWICYDILKYTSLLFWLYGIWRIISIW